MKGPELLAKFIADEKISAAEFSRRSDGRIDEPALSKYLAGKVAPRIETALLIEQLTNKLVPIASWIAPRKSRKAA